jgi:hypothetical protein
MAGQSFIGPHVCSNRSGAHRMLKKTVSAAAASEEARHTLGVR